MLEELRQGLTLAQTHLEFPMPMLTLTSTILSFSHSGTIGCFMQEPPRSVIPHLVFHKFSWKLIMILPAYINSTFYFWGQITQDMANTYITTCIIKCLS